MHKSQFHKTDPYDWFCAPGGVHKVDCLGKKLYSQAEDSVCERRADGEI